MSEVDRSCRASLTLKNKDGLHARPANLWVQTANGYASELRVTRSDGPTVDGKSILGVMMLAAECGVTLEVESVGPDCEAQIRALEELVAASFGEA